VARGETSNVKRETANGRRGRADAEQTAARNAKGETQPRYGENREERAMSSGEQTKVLSPLGFPPAVKPTQMAERPESLSGKTVYLVDCRFDDGDILVEQMADWFSEHEKGVHIEVRRKSGVYTQRDPELYEEIKAKGDAAVVAVGH